MRSVRRNRRSFISTICRPRLRRARVCYTRRRSARRDTAVVRRVARQMPIFVRQHRLQPVNGRDCRSANWRRLVRQQQQQSRENGNAAMRGSGRHRRERRSAVLKLIYLPRYHTPPVESVTEKHATCCCVGSSCIHACVRG